MDARYKLPPATLEGVPQFASGYGSALMAVAVKV